MACTDEASAAAVGVVMVVVKDPLRFPGGGGDGRQSHALVICLT
jgi:hypothetical protein